jgi:hypothetical protein
MAALSARRGWEKWTARPPIERKLAPSVALRLNIFRGHFSLYLPGWDRKSRLSPDMHAGIAGSGSVGLNGFSQSEPG